MTDLKFADFEKEKIAANKIDTVFLISKNKVLNFAGSDTFGRIEYDRIGNVLRDDRNEFMGTTIRYEYDSIGFVKLKRHSTDFTAQFKATYKFIPDSLILKQFWKGTADDTCLFKFGETGKLIESNEYVNDDHGRGKHSQKTYEYNSSGQLIKITNNNLINKKWLFDIEKAEGTIKSTQNITDLYYSENILDSTITKFYYFSKPNKIDISKTIYDKDGLRFKSINMDTIITTYAYKKRIN